METIRLGISKCLLGEAVRYDGQHKLDRYIRDTLGNFVSFVPVCPEVDCGLPVPRESMRLVGRPDDYRLLTSRSGRDITPQMKAWIPSAIEKLKSEKISGFIFKKGSPSSAFNDAKIYSGTGIPIARGPGIFASEVIRNFPLIPCEDEGRLNDDNLRENFIERLFVYARWQEFLDSENAGPAGLVGFHMKHKLLVMAHSPSALKALGQLVAQGRKGNHKEICDSYVRLLMDALKLQATVRKNVNVLMHIAGYFKKQLSGIEKEEFQEVLEAYMNGLLPLIVPVTLLNHYVRVYGEAYLAEQYYLNPHPLELKLRNHV